MTRAQILEAVKTWGEEKICDFEQVAAAAEIDGMTREQSERAAFFLLVENGPKMSDEMMP